MVTPEQILVIFIKCPLFFLSKAGADPQLFYLLRGLNEIQLKSREFLLKIHGWRIKTDTIKRIFLIFLRPPFF